MGEGLVVDKAVKGSFEVRAHIRPHPLGELVESGTTRPALIEEYETPVACIKARIQDLEESVEVLNDWGSSSDDRVNDFSRFVGRNRVMQATLIKLWGETASPPALPLLGPARVSGPFGGTPPPEAVRFIAKENRAAAV